MGINNRGSNPFASAKYNNTKDINITFLCPGTRLVADWQADEIGIGIPFEKWNQVVAGVKETANPFERDTNKKGIKNSALMYFLLNPSL